MPIERYLYALLPSGEYILDYTSGLDGFCDETLEYIRTREVGSHVYWLPLEQCVVRQLVESTDDRSGREGVWNSAAIIPINEYLQLTDPYALLEPYLIVKCENPLKLNPIPLASIGRVG